MKRFSPQTLPKILAWNRLVDIVTEDLAAQNTVLGSKSTKVHIHRISSIWQMAIYPICFLIFQLFQLDSMVDIDAIYSKGSRDSDGYDCILVYIHKPKRNGKASKIWSRKLWWVSRIGGKCISLWFGRHLIHTACWFAWSTHRHTHRWVMPGHAFALAHMMK